MRLLLVEDDLDLAEALVKSLRQIHMVVDVAHSLMDAQHLLQTGPYDVTVLDRRLPDGDGVSLLDFMAQKQCRTPVLILSSRGEVSDRVVGLDCGADDYIAKPFALDELLARIRALARRPHTRETQNIEVGMLRFDENLRQVFVRDVPLVLPRRELLALEVLLRNKQRTVLRATLLERIYEGESDINSNALDSHLSRLRSKLATAGARVEIHAIRGVGYLLREQTHAPD